MEITYENQKKFTVHQLLRGLTSSLQTSDRYLPIRKKGKEKDIQMQRKEKIEREERKRREKREREKNYKQSIII